MISGSVRDAEKSITSVATKASPVFGSASADLMMSRAPLSTDAHQQDGYPDATESRCSLSTIPKSPYLTEDRRRGDKVTIQNVLRDRIRRSPTQVERHSTALAARLQARRKHQPLNTMDTTRLAPGAQIMSTRRAPGSLSVQLRWIEPSSSSSRRARALGGRLSQP